MSDLGAIVVTPDEVHDAKMQLDAQWRALHSAWELANTDPTVPPHATLTIDFIKFEDVYAAWSQFAIDESGWLSAASDFDRVHDYAKQLAQWQSTFEDDASALHLAGSALPNVVDPPDPKGGADREAEALWAIAKPVLVVGGVALLAYALIEWLPELELARRARAR